MTLHAHFVGNRDGDGVAVLLDGIEHGRHVHIALAPDHEVDNSDLITVVKLHELVADVHIVAHDDVAQRLDILDNAMHLDTDNLGFPHEIVTLLEALNVDQDKDDEQSRDDADQIHAGTHRQTDTCCHPDARCCGQTAH